MTVYTNKYKIPFQIDKEDYESVSNYFWHKDGNGYLMTNIRKYDNGTCVGHTQIILHHFLMGKAGIGLYWDHIDRNKMNNYRYNLRIVDPVTSGFNSSIRFTNMSGYPGVYATAKGFGAYLAVKGKRIRLGNFNTYEEAVATRRIAELKYRGMNYIINPTETKVVQTGQQTTA